MKRNIASYVNMLAVMGRGSASRAGFNRISNATGDVIQFPSGKRVTVDTLQHRNNGVHRPGPMTSAQLQSTMAPAPESGPQPNHTPALNPFVPRPTFQ